MDRHIKDIFEKQEAEDRIRLETDYTNLILSEFKDAEAILSMDRRLILNETPVRCAVEFSIRKHTAVLVPYYHSHDFYEMIYVYEGICRQYINENKKEFILQKGDICFITPGTIHSILPCQQEDIILKIIIPAKMFSELKNHAFEDTDKFMMKIERANEFCFFPVSINENGSVRQLFEKILSECYFEDSYKQTSVKSCLALLFIALARHKVNLPESGLLYQITKQINNNLKNALLKEIATDMGYSPRHLERLLLKEAGCTFSDILQKLRMDKAAQLLIETDYTLEQIADMTGYRTEAGFYKRFRLVFGTTPNHYRKSHTAV